MNLFRFIPGYTSHIYDAHKEPLLFLFIAFLITFALVRLYTRLARTRGWGSGSVGGVHMHHVVVGVVFMVVSGIVAFTQFSYDSEIVYSLAAIFFGIGLALTLDEFAMIFHLKDVYWTEQGRTSIDAMLMGVAGSGLLLVSSAPSGDDPGIVIELGSFRIETGIFVALAINLGLAVITFLKKKPILGVFAIVLPLFGIVTATRLAKPSSPWAHWFYDPERGSERLRRRRERKLARSTRRYTVGWSGRFERWFSDIVGGAPSLPSTVAHDGGHQPDPP